LLRQIDEKRSNSVHTPIDLGLNKDYINNIKQIKDLLQEEIAMKERTVVPIVHQKRIIANHPP